MPNILCRIDNDECAQYTGGYCQLGNPDECNFAETEDEYYYLEEKDVKSQWF